ncbi:hypothetical protein MYXE_13600 [Mycobacterium xenopi]|uniref:PNPLA domain-containing protein n=1 Tax=Mycobacterium xenopi TaxID=1789 RepID=A0AAD1GYG4_MYCXE|nr:hypothetical protein MYXE_13600 [Mycobacterium xenopi]
MAAKRALVLAGGGIAGISWETGVLQGIADQAPQTARTLLDCDVLVGTSAGSAVAAQISSGSALDELYARQIAPTSAELDPGVGVETITELFFNAITKPGTTRQKLRRIGAIAAATDTVAEPVRREVIAGRLPSHHWPDRDLRLTAIDIVTGERVVFDRESGVDLVDAVAASCAVPGAWPPVTIGERRYMDGGVASSVNLDIAADCDVAVVLVPSSGAAPSPFGAARVPRSRPSTERHSVCSPTTTRWLRSEPTRWTRAAGWRRRKQGGHKAGETLPPSPLSWTAPSSAARGQLSLAGGAGSSTFRLSSASMASVRPTSITSAARWNSKPRQTVRGTSINKSGG